MLRVTSPFDGSSVAEIPYDAGAGLEAKLRASRSAFERWRLVPLEERMRRVRDGVACFRAAKEAIARDITRQMGKPIVEARREVDTCCGRAEHMLSIAAKSLAPDLLPAAPPFQLRIEHVPYGVVLNIAAWNYPLLIPINVIAPALIAGNVVILKHSARTPLCGLCFESAFGQGELSGLVTNVVLTHEVTSAVIADPRIDHVAFTGSVAGGREVYREAARRLIDAGLELGGKDPAYVAEDADLDFAAENVVDGACYNAGQSCCAVERVYVHEKVSAEFLRRARAVLERYRLGDPLDETTTLGPLASAGGVKVCEEQVRDAVARGGKLLLGGKRPAGLKGCFFEPTLLADVPNDALVMQEETFGPIVPVATVRGDDEAIARMNDSRYGLTASVWTRSAERAERCAREVEAGTIYQNRCDYLDPALAWTGYKESGKGCTLSSYGFHQLTRLKSIHFRTRTTT